MHHTEHIFSWSLVLILKILASFKYSAIMCTYLFAIKSFLHLQIFQEDVTCCSCSFADTNTLCHILSAQPEKHFYNVKISDPNELKKVQKEYSAPNLHPSDCYFGTQLSFWLGMGKISGCHFQGKRASSFYFTRLRDFLGEKSRG